MRRVPPAILLALALWFADALLRTLLMLRAEVYYRAFPDWFHFVGIGLKFTVPMLLLGGLLELRQRSAALGVVALVAVECVWMALPTEMWRQPQTRELISYGALAAELIFAGSLASAVWTKRPGLAVAAIAGAILIAPPPSLASLLYGLVAHDYNRIALLELVMPAPIYIALLLISIELSRDSEPRPIIAARGLRQGAGALCVFSAIAALLGIRALHQPLLLTAFEAGSLAWAAMGVLRAAQTPLSRWIVTAAAACLLWCASVQLCALPRIYYHQPAPDLSVVMALMPIAAAAFMTIALANTVDKIQLQAKGVGAILMFVTALAIQVFLVPQAQSERSIIALDVLTGFVMALGAWMLSWLCRLAAERLECASELPVARVL